MKKSIITIIFAICTLAVFSPGQIAQAQVVSTPVTQGNYHQGEVFTLPILISSPTQSVNAFTFSVSLPPNVSFVGSDESGSIVTLWVDAPRLENGDIIFSGAIPAGFTTLLNPLNQERGAGLVTKLILRGESAGGGQIHVNPSVYANDGLGTKLHTSDFSFDLEIDDIVVNKNYVWDDARIPEPFTATIERSPSVYDNKFTLVFLATDKNSGIDHYEVREGFGEWYKATSPYLLLDQDLHSTITVKAVDKAGNERLVLVPARNGVKSNFVSQFISYGFLLLVILIVGIFRKKIFGLK